MKSLRLYEITIAPHLELEEMITPLSLLSSWWIHHSCNNITTFTIKIISNILFGNYGRADAAAGMVAKNCFS